MLRAASGPIVLASASPRRAALLASAGIPFTVVPSAIAEDRRPDEAPAALVRRLARAKAREVAERSEGRFVLGAAGRRMGRGWPLRGHLQRPPRGGRGIPAGGLIN